MKLLVDSFPIIRWKFSKNRGWGPKMRTFREVVLAQEILGQGEKPHQARLEAELIVVDAFRKAMGKVFHGLSSTVIFRRFFLRPPYKM